MNEYDFGICTKHGTYMTKNLISVCSKCEQEKNEELNTLRSRVEELENELAEAGKNQSEYHNTVLAQEKEVARLREMVRWRKASKEDPEYDDFYHVLLFVGRDLLDDWVQFSNGMWHNIYVKYWVDNPIPPEVSHE